MQGAMPPPRSSLIHTAIPPPNSPLRGETRKVANEILFISPSGTERAIVPTTADLSARPCIVGIPGKGRRRHVIEVHSAPARTERPGLGDSERGWKAGDGEILSSPRQMLIGCWTFLCASPVVYGGSVGRPWVS